MVLEPCLVVEDLVTLVTEEPLPLVLASLMDLKQFRIHTTNKNVPFTFSFGPWTNTG